MQVNTKLKEKIYYNIDIVSNPKPGEFASEAKFSTILQHELIHDASSFQMMVHKIME